MKRVLVVGELNADVILAGCQAPPTPGKEVLARDAALVLGSASAICAVGLARLGHRVSFRGKVGADRLGDLCLEALGAEGIDVARVDRDPALRTGLTASLSGPGDRALVTFPGAVAALGPEDVAGERFEGFDHLHVSSYFLQARLRPGCRALFGRARRAGLTTSLDPGHDPDERWGPDLVETLAEVDVFLPNEPELLAIAGAPTAEEALRRLAGGRTRTVVKLGTAGCATLEAGAVVRAPAFPVAAVDTTGAGDAFDAGFLHGLLSGWPLAACLRAAAACGALSTRALGGTAAQPRAGELAAFLAASR